MDTPDHALTAAGPSGGGTVRALRAFLAKPRNRIVVLGLLFAGCWITAAVKMSDVTGLDGLAVGIPLAAAPVPLVVGAFLLLARARPQPWQHLAFALSWGAGAGALAALYANSWSIDAIVDRSGEYQGELLGLTVVAPFVEELAKGAAVLLLLLFRRPWFRGPLDGLVLAATTAAGFAFTENVLYFGRAFGEGSDEGDAAAQTAAIFLGRAILTPFAHPLFTAATGLALGIAVLLRNRSRAVLVALGGYLVAVGLHSAWNGSAWKTTVDDEPAIMLSVYFLVMAPLLAGVFVTGHKLRGAQLDAVRTQLPHYVGAGWFSWNEPYVLGSVADRNRQRRAALALYGKPGERAARQYHWNATALAELRRSAVRGGVTAEEFTPQERVFLDRLWELRHALGEVPERTMPTPRWGPMPTYGWTQAAAWPQYGPAGVPQAAGPPYAANPYAAPAPAAAFAAHQYGGAYPYSAHPYSAHPYSAQLYPAHLYAANPYTAHPYAAHLYAPAHAYAAVPHAGAAHAVVPPGWSVRPPLAADSQPAAPNPVDAVPPKPSAAPASEPTGG
ncbi:PrsW family intramembrane metalloprotease [Streptodolium elevatio]|uniref:PrsW family glutamic-type intramembrane protease n=1 Tax=Streptodolium elevatio TaxID=3157996 RepID=A0ABV3DNF3_9ACTN